MDVLMQLPSVLARRLLREVSNRPLVVSVSDERYGWLSLLAAEANGERVTLIIYFMWSPYSESYQI